MQRHLSCILRTARTCAAIVSLVLAAPALAQTGGLEAQRSAVFQRLLAAPDDRALMHDYARLSVQLRDYEAAVATLERALLLDPTDGTARYELAIAYQALGALELANYHFGHVAPADPATADELAAYQSQNQRSQATSRLRGQVAAGAIHRSGDTHAIGRAQIIWRNDLAGRNRDYWQTDLNLTVLGGSSTLNDRQRIALRTGPWLTLGDTAYGVRLRPYLEARLERDSDGATRRLGLVGLQYANTHTRELSSFADVKLGRIMRSGASRNVGQLSLGATYRPSRDTRLRAAARVEREWATGTRLARRGLRLDAAHEFAVAELPRKWVANAHIQADWIRETGATPRREQVRAAGIGLRAFATREVFVDLAARAERRSSDIAARNQRNTIFTVQIGREF